MSHPDWLGVLLLALAAFRLTRLAGWDEITAAPRRWITGLGDEEHHRLAAIVQRRVDAAEEPLPPDAPVSPFRFYVSKLVRCPWCVGFWISVAVWGAWLAWPHATLGVSVPLAVSSLVGLVAKNLDP